MAFGGEGAAVDDAKGFFLFVIFMVGQGTFLSDFSHLQFITGCDLSLCSVPACHSEAGQPFKSAVRLSKVQLHLKVERLIHFGDTRKRNAYAREAD
jgi:hypothetical protein